MMGRGQWQRILQFALKPVNFLQSCLPILQQLPQSALPGIDAESFQNVISQDVPPLLKVQCNIALSPDGGKHGQNRALLQD